MRPRRLISGRFLPALGLLVAAAACGGTTPEVYDLDGRAVDPLRDSDARAVVLVFTRGDCPISNRYAPELRRLYEEHAAGGVAFYLVYPDPGQTAAAIRAHLAAYDLPAPALRDPRHALVKAAGVTVTPEAAVFLPGGRRVYRGRIDDRWVTFGQERAAPTRHDLRAVLAAIVAGHPVAPAETTWARRCRPGPSCPTAAGNGCS